MRYENLYIDGVGAWFPRQEPVAAAIERGDYTRAAQERSGQQRVAVATAADPHPEMAVRAGRTALSRSDRRDSDVCLLLHAVSNYNGLEGWNAASYLQQRILSGHGVSFEIRQLSNGALASVDLAASYLTAGAGRRAAMLTASDQFALPFWNRWTSNLGMVLGDGASALVLTGDAGFAQVLSLVTVADPGLEGLQRGNRELGPGPDPALQPVDLWMRNLEFFDVMDLDEAGARMAAGLREAATRAVAEAGMGLHDATHYVVPNLGRDTVRRECLEPLGIDIARTTWDWGSHIGHCGTADQFAALNHLAETGALTPGDRVMMISVGGGFNWTCAVVEILREPAV
jgi:3-oxoacyl-[acyl-carrier-protein] synthase III